MKKLLPLFFCMCAVLSSCGLFSPAMTSGTVTSTPNGAVVNPLAATLSSIAPNHRNLKAQEDPGTGLYGFLNEFGVWVISPKYTYASDFHSDLGLIDIFVCHENISL